jgi:hypothetical protein
MRTLISSYVLIKAKVLWYKKAIKCYFYKSLSLTFALILCSVSGLLSWWIYDIILRFTRHMKTFRWMCIVCKIIPLVLGSMDSYICLLVLLNLQDRCCFVFWNRKAGRRDDYEIPNFQKVWLLNFISAFICRHTFF